MDFIPVKGQVILSTCLKGDFSGNGLLLPTGVPQFTHFILQGKMVGNIGLNKRVFKAMFYHLMRIIYRRSKYTNRAARHL